MQKKCPYCIQDIPEDANVCPYCDSKLKIANKSKNLNKPSKPVFFPLGVALSFLWILGNILIIVLFTNFPDIISHQDKNGYYTFMLADYAQLCLIPLVYTTIPFIISIIKNINRSLCISFIVLDVFCALCFISYCSHLFDTVR